MFVKKLFNLILIILMPILALAQESDAIQPIRDRYYRINNGSIELQQISFQDSDYYFEGNKLSIVKKKTNNGRYEYYYEFKNGKYFPYFIYFEPNDNTKPQLRAYYDDSQNLILLKKGEVESTYGEYEKNPFKYLKQDAHNSLNLIFNYFVLVQHPNDIRIGSILKEVESINRSIVVTDTVEFNNYEDGGSFGTFKYLNREQKVVKTSSFSGGEHGGSIENKYLLKGKVIYSTKENESWVGFYSRITASMKFYENRKLFREDYIDSESTGKVLSISNEKYFLEWFELKNVTPRVVYME